MYQSCCMMPKNSCQCLDQPHGLLFGAHQTHPRSLTVLRDCHRWMEQGLGWKAVSAGGSMGMMAGGSWQSPGGCLNAQVEATQLMVLWRDAAMSLLLVSSTQGSCHGTEEGAMVVWLRCDQGPGCGCCHCHWAHREASNCSQTAHHMPGGKQ